jgi:hypothetical protein
MAYIYTYIYMYPNIGRDTTPPERYYKLGVELFELYLKLKSEGPKNSNLVLTRNTLLGISSRDPELLDADSNQASAGKVTTATGIDTSTPTSTSSGSSGSSRTSSTSSTSSGSSGSSRTSSGRIQPIRGGDCVIPPSSINLAPSDVTVDEAIFTKAANAYRFVIYILIYI